jgi:hypothetical protein
MASKIDVQDSLFAINKNFELLVDLIPLQFYTPKEDNQV